MVAGVVTVIGLVAMGLTYPFLKPGDHNVIVALKEKLMSEKPAAGSSGPTDAERVKFHDELVQREHQRLLDQKKQAEQQRIKMRLEEAAKRKAAIVVVTDVVGEPNEASYYLVRRFEKALRHYYMEAVERAKQKTEQNRKSAEQEAKAKAKNTFSLVVFYQYRQEFPDLPAPMAKELSRTDDGEITFEVAPVPDVNDFARRVEIGRVLNVDAGKRKVTIQSLIPAPVPDVDREELEIAYGLGKAATVWVNGVEPRPNVDRYLSDQLMQYVKSVGGGGIVLGPFRPQGTGRLRFQVAPVEDVEAFASLIKFGSPDEIDVAKRIINVTAKLPDELPDPVARSLAGPSNEGGTPDPNDINMARKRNLPTNADKEPRPGEDELAWIIRILANGTSFAQQAAIERLEKIEEIPDQQREALVDAMEEMIREDTFFGKVTERVVERFAQLDESRAITLLIEQLTDRRSSASRVVYALAKIKNPRAAEAIASMMTDFFTAKDASAALRRMGPVAEDAVLELSNSSALSMQVEACKILGVVGTEKSLRKLKGLAARARNPELRTIAANSVRLIEGRLEETKQSDGA